MYIAAIRIDSGWPVSNRRIVLTPTATSLVVSWRELAEAVDAESVDEVSHYVHNIMKLL